MKEGVSSIEYAQNWYGDSWLTEAINLNPELASLMPVFEKNPLSFFDLFDQELATTENNIFQTLASGGESIMNSIQAGLTELGGKLKEQIAALFLREKFGAPGDPIVSAVWAELAQREVLAIKDSKSGGLEVQSLFDQLRSQVVEKIKLAIAAEINQVEEQIKTYETAQKNSQSFATETPEIGEQLNSHYQTKFEQKFLQLKTKKRKLENLFKLIGQKFSFTEGQNQGRVVFEAARQTTAPTLLTA